LPYDVDWVLGFLARRAVRGLERVAGPRYERVVPEGVVAIEFARAHVAIAAPSEADAADVVHRVRALLDLDRDAACVEQSLGRDPDMAARIAQRPGLRVPGTWDVFELAVRAVLGQQVSVERGTALVTRLVDRFGSHTPTGGRAFPVAGALVDADVAAIGIPGRRAAAIRALAAAASADAVSGPTLAPERVRSMLTGMPGIGPWTREYVAMRAGRDADAFPDGDWVVLRELGTTAAGARRRADAWRPWRAYAVMYLWAANARRKGLR